MKLAVAPPLLPMLAKRVSELPRGDDWIFEPKWDGFRTLIFRDGDELLLQSRDQKSLNRYFPELIAPLLAGLPKQCVLDGEIVVARGGGLDFDALQLRVHPAASRVKLLSQELPASVVFFDVLCEGSHDLRSEPFRMRRARLESRATERRTAAVHHAQHDRPHAGERLVQALRGRGAGWRHGQSRERQLRAEQARHVQGQT